MTLYMQLENELAESRGIDLPFIREIAPETAVRWREDNSATVYAMLTDVISKH